MQAWLLTNTTYGTWLPGDRRGSVTSVRDLRPEDFEVLACGDSRFEHDEFGQPLEPHMPGLNKAARKQMKGPPIYLDFEKAELVWKQFLETAEHRRWKLHAMAIMRDHFHLVISLPVEVDPKRALADLKAYASRTLNKRFGVPPGETWWTSKGSKRKLVDGSYFANANKYVLFKQPSPLVVWSVDKGRLV